MPNSNASCFLYVTENKSGNWKPIFLPDVPQNIICFLLLGTLPQNRKLDTTLSKTYILTIFHKYLASSHFDCIYVLSIKPFKRNFNRYWQPCEFWQRFGKFQINMNFDILSGNSLETPVFIAFTNMQRTWILITFTTIFEEPIFYIIPGYISKTWVLLSWTQIVRISKLSRRLVPFLKTVVNDHFHTHSLHFDPSECFKISLKTIGIDCDINVHGINSNCTKCPFQWPYYSFLGNVCKTIKKYVSRFVRKYISNFAKSSFWREMRKAYLKIVFI